ncbi:Formylaminopyrimidine-binding protein [Paraconexibacter sp. AEG42_29]|uniref:Thiamine pyrimidine synthase n=1 Tax=Paraconexibacter sp. AEG42_29 TaxID=2997339 RepID=A0AAU7AZ55_9ACTN
MVPRPTARRLAAAAAIVLTLAASGCGGDDEDAGRAPATVRIALDFTPNAVHAPIFAAARTGADRRHGIRLDVERPGSQPDSLKALTSGAADVGVLDIQDLAIARAKGADVVAIGALVQRPLGALVTQPQISRPKDLDGRTAGVSGLPSDGPFLKAIVEDDGGDYGSIRQVTIGFAAVSALLGRKVDAVPVFWNVEGIVLKQKGRRFNEFRIDEYGAPRFPEVVLVTTTRLLREQRGRVLDTLRAIRDGARSVRQDPDPAIREIARESGDADLGLVRAQFAALRPIVDPELTLRRAVIEQWAVFTQRVGLLDTAPDVDAAFAFGLR